MGKRSWRTSRFEVAVMMCAGMAAAVTLMVVSVTAGGWWWLLAMPAWPAAAYFAVRGAELLQGPGRE